MKIFWRVTWHGTMFAALSFLVLLISSDTTQAQAPVNLICGPLRQVPAEPLGGFRDTLLDVAALSNNDVWAVGGSLPFATMTEHWDGFQWTLIASPNLGANVNTLTSVTAIAPDDVWAVGYEGLGGLENNLVLHWDGVQWQVIPTSNLTPQNSPSESVEHSNPQSVPVPDGGPQNFLYGSAMASDGLWAVGTVYWWCTFDGICHSTTFAMHHTGIHWLQTSTPNPSTGTNLLNSVAVVSANDVWAVGSRSIAVAGSTIGQTLILHWDGNSWSQVLSPNQGSSHNNLMKVVALSSSDVWAMGYASGATLIEHWDGMSWSIVPSPNAPSPFGLNLLTGATLISASDIYAVGWYLPGFTASNAQLSRATMPDLIPLASLAPKSISQPLILHWDGSAWSLVPTPWVANPNALYGVSATRGSDRALFAVGSYFSQPDYAMLPLAMQLGPHCQNYLPFVAR